MRLSWLIGIIAHTQNVSTVGVNDGDAEGSEIELIE